MRHKPFSNRGRLPTKGGGSCLEMEVKPSGESFVRDGGPPCAPPKSMAVFDIVLRDAD